MKKKDNYFRIKFLFILFAICLFFIQNDVVSAAQFSLMLKWKPSSDKNSDYLIGYVVYWGKESGKYTNRVDVGEKYNYTITNLKEGNTYYFAVKSYSNDSYIESNFSNEIAINIGKVVQSRSEDLALINQPPISSDAGAGKY